MAITTIFYDLDGTLLPMDMDEFIGGYLKLLCEKMVPYGFEPKALAKNIMKGTGVMQNNDGSVTNEEAFWTFFRAQYPDIDMDPLIAVFEDFYRNEFKNAKCFVGFNEKARYTVDEVAKLGFKQVLATNPYFPDTATDNRIKWAGLDRAMFETITTYEHYHYCKPNTKYYLELLDRLKLVPQEVLMVGNDVDEDMVAKDIGMQVFLLTDCMINKNNKDIECYRHGSFDELMSYIKQLKEQ